MNTLYDLFSHVLDTEDAADDPVNRRRALRAAAWGAQQVQSRHAWAGYTTTENVILYAPITTAATVSGDGILTVDAGEPDLPIWAGFATVVIDRIPYSTYRRIDNRSVALDNYSGAVIATPDNVRFACDRHKLTDTVRDIYSVRDESSEVNLNHVGPAQYRALLNRQDGVPNIPVAVTVVRSDTPHGRTTELRFVPSPSQDLQYSVAYHRNPRVSRTVHDCFSVEINAGIAVVNKSLASTELLGGVLLVSENAQRPDGTFAFGVDEATRAEHILRIKSVTDRRTFVLEDSSITGITGRGGVITEELDFPPFAYNAAQRYAEAEFRRVGRGEVGEYWQTIKMADAELRLAMEQEATLRTEMPIATSRVGVYHLPENLVVSSP